MSTRRSRRKSGAASAGDNPCGSEAAAALTDSSSNTSPTRRRARDGTSPRASSKNNNEFAKNELASRILGQLNDLRNIACRQLHAGGEEIVELEHLVGGMTKSADGKSISQAQSLMSLFTSPKITSKPDSGNNSTAQHSPRISCDSTKLLPIEVKVEDVIPDSPSVSYSEQQPSTSSAMTVSQSGVSLSGVASQATPTPRSSVAIGTESNVERAAKQEAQVLARVAELRRQGLWTASRLPMIDMPARNKTHWDYLLEEMRWMAADFRQERTFKRHAAKKFATQIARLQRDKEQEEERAQQRAIREAKRVCALIAKMVRDFWQNVDKVVDYRAQEIIESMKRKALDQQLELMVGQADKLSEMVQEGLTEKVSKAPSVADEDEKSDDKDVDFAGGVESESDDETTIAKAEATIDTNVEEEVQDLEREKDLELDDLLASLPAEYLASMGLPSKPGPSKARDDSEEHSDGDESENEDLDETTTDGDSEGDGEEAEGGDEDGKKDISKADQRIPSENGEPPPKKKKSPDQVVEEETTTTSPTQCDSAMRSASSASIKESELSSSSIPPSEDASKDVPEGGINFDRLNSENSEDRQKELANIAEEALKFQPKGFTLETTQVKTDVPSLIRGTLREYQLVGLDWLVTLYDKGLNGILADEMGLGKTIQTIALLAHLACKEAIWGPHLIVVPTSVILNWEMELKKWCPAFKILTYFGSQKERAEKRRGWSKPNMFHVCVTSYKIVTQDIRAFKHKAWQYFILDEAQNIKNFKSQRWQMLLNIRARRRLLLTGTPLQNSLMELWSLMHFLMPAIFASHNDFKDWFSNPLTGMMEGNIEWNAPLVQRLHKVLRPFILRRLKSEVEKQLPEKTEHVVKCPLSKRQRYLYDDFMSLRSTRENLRSGNVMSVLNIVMQLRKCCNHPNLFEPRPVVSPFAMQALSVTVPAMLLDLCKSANSNEDIPSIPECLRLSHLIRGSQFAWSEIRRLSAGRTLIEELNSQQQQQQDSDGSSIPKVDSFKFVRPPPPPAETKQQQEVQSQQTVNNIAAVSMPAGNLPQTGEYYVCVDNGTARVYQLVTTSSGERTIQECDPSTVAGGAAASAQVVSAVEVPAAVQPIRVVTPPIISVVAQPIASTSHRDIEIKTEIKTEETVADATEMVDGSATEQHQQITTSNKLTDRRAVFRTKTVLNKTVVRSGHALKQDLQSINNGCTSVGTTIPYQVSGSSDSSTRSRCVAEVRPLTAEGVPLQTVTPMITNGEARHLSTSATVASSPPQKRRRINTPKIERQPHAELLLPETRQLQKDRRQECAQRIVDWCVRHSEWANVKRAPLVSDELLSIVINEVKRKHRPKARNATAHPEKGKMPIVELNAFECSDELGWIRDRLRQFVEDMVERFTVYVHGAIANAPSLQPTSSGRFAYRKQMDEDVNMACRHLFESFNDPLVFQCRTMQTLQFPELRLIEYDCGKLQVLSTLLRDLFIYKHRCLIFTQMSRMLDVLQAFLSFHGYQYFRLDGTTGIEQRQAMMERFNSDPKIFCFILSTRSGGIGVNLTGADTVIFYDSDWNPTMDAQAQDRCHRIGQTRNVTIYRLISERTIEENILKKAMQKRRLGELAIDEAGFTPEFFKGDNLRELFQGEAAVADVVAPVSVNDPAELEKVMARLEDVQDVAAANRANAEAKAELAEFDENVQPKEDNVSNSNALDGTDSKYFELLNQLKPIERYAINFLEAEYKPDFEEEVKEAEAMIASKKDEWLKAHETVLEGGDGDELNDDDDEFDVTYANGFKIPGSIDEMICLEYPDEQMPLWTPLSPPISDAEDDLYYDRCGDLWYEHEVMCESRLPALIHELHRPRPLTQTTVPIASQSAPNVAPYAHQASSLSSAAIHQQHPTSFGMAAAAAAAGLSAAHQPTQLLQSLPVTAHRHQSSLMPNESSLLGTSAQNTILSSNIPIGANSAISQSSMVPSSLRGDMRGSCMLSAQSMTLSGQHEQHQQRERMMKTIPQTGVTSGSPYLDTSNLLRPATPSRIPNSVDDAIDSVRKSAQKSSSSFGSMSRSYGGSSRSLFSDGRSIKSDLRRPLTPPPRENEAIDYEGPEWLIIEDFALILAVAHEQHFSYHLNSAKPGHTINWDFVSRLMMRYTSFYRSPRQCSIHYQLVVQPREEGRTMALDPVTKKSRKVPVSSVELMHMKRDRRTTEQQYNVDALKIRAGNFMQRTRALKQISMAMKRRPVLKSNFVPQNLLSLHGRLPVGQEMKLAEFGVRYQNAIPPMDLIEYRNERRAKLHEQEKERQRIREEDERQKEASGCEQQNERDQKAQKRESAVMALPGHINYQQATMVSILEQCEMQSQSQSIHSLPQLHQQQQQQVSVTLSHIPGNGVGTGTMPITSTRTIGSAALQQQHQQQQQQQVSMASGNGGMMTQNVSTVGDSQTTQVIVGQRAYSDHQQVTSLPSMQSGVHHHTNTRRVQIPSVAASGLQAQHQIVMTGNGNNQLAQSSSQQPYTVVVSSQDNILTGGTSQMSGTRIQYTTRQEGPSERQTIYRTIAPTGTKRTSPANPAQRVGLPMAYATTSSGQPTQIYSSASHSGRALIVSSSASSQPNAVTSTDSNSNQSMNLNDQPQLQMMRPQLQPVSTQSVRHDVRPKIAQRTQNRVYLTTSGGERTYLMPQPQVRMLPSGQRITQKRTATGTLQAKTLGGGQQQVTMMVPSRGGGIQQVRAVPRGTLRRNIASGYQSTRMPSINLIMSGGSGARNNETIGGSGTTRQLPPPGSQLMSGGGVAHSRQILSNAPSSSQGPISRQLAAITAQNPAAVSSSSSTGLSSSPSSSQSTNITTSYVRTIPASPTIVSQDHYTGPIPTQLQQQQQSLPPISLSSTQSTGITQQQQQQQRLTPVTPRQNTTPVGTTSPSPIPQTQISSTPSNNASSVGGTGSGGVAVNASETGATSSAVSTSSSVQQPPASE